MKKTIEQHAQATTSVVTKQSLDQTKTLQELQNKRMDKYEADILAMKTTAESVTAQLKDVIERQAEQQQRQAEQTMEALRTVTTAQANNLTAQANNLEALKAHSTNSIDQFTDGLAAFKVESATALLAMKTMIECQTKQHI